MSTSNGLEKTLPGTKQLCTWCPVRGQAESEARKPHPVRLRRTRLSRQTPRVLKRRRADGGLFFAGFRGAYDLTEERSTYRRGWPTFGEIVGGGEPTRGQETVWVGRLEADLKRSSAPTVVRRMARGSAEGRQVAPRSRGRGAGFRGGKIMTR